MKGLAHILVPLAVLALLLSEYAFPQKNNLDNPATKSNLIVVEPEFDPSPSCKPKFSPIPYRPLKRTRIALVLSGGGARGIAQVGVLKVFEKYNIPVDFIVGSSIGGIVGGLYATGYKAAQLEKIVKDINWDEVLALTEEAKRKDLFVPQKEIQERSILVIRFDEFEPIIPSSVVSGQRFTNMINMLALQGIYHPNPSFDDLKIPFRAVTTDLVSGKRIVIDRGDLSEAMRASATVPIVFAPVEKDSMQLLDGGILSNIPVDVAKNLGYDAVIAVNTTSGLRSADEVKALWETADQITSIMQQKEDREQLANADVVITPRIGKHRSTNFTGLDTLIALGEAEAEKKIGEIVSMIQRRERRSGDSSIHGKFGVEIRGDKIPDSLRQMILFRPKGDSILLSTIENDVRNIYELGFYSDVRARIELDTVNTKIVYLVKSNPILRGVDLQGNHLLLTSDLTKPFESIIWNPIRVSAVQNALESVLEQYREKGYSLARIDSVRLEEGTGLLHLTLDEGVIQKVVVDGNTKTKNHVILREFPLHEGEVFAVDKANQGIVNVSSMNLFPQVLLEVRYESDKPLVIIKVVERSSELARLGIRTDNERNTMISVDVRDENLFGLGMEFGGRFLGGFSSHTMRQWLLEYRANRLFETYFTYNVKGYYKFRDVFLYADDPAVMAENRWNRISTGEYEEIKYGGSATVGAQFEKLGNVTAEVKLEKHHVETTLGEPVSTEDFRLISLKLGSTIDSQDKFPFPNGGVLINISYETALDNWGSQISFSKIFFSYENYTTYGGHTLHPKFVFGFADATFPLSEQFSLGGQNLFYGLREDEFRGRQIFAVSLEYRFLLPIKIFFDTYFKARYDLGSAWAQRQNIRFKDLRHGIGAELAFDTPIGPAGFALGKSFILRRTLPNNPISWGPTIVYFMIGFNL
jgi:NTE family protein